MIKKLEEEWESLSRDAGQAANQDPQRQGEILERMHAVGQALRELTQSSVSRTRLSKAVRDALAEILKNEKEALLPELSRLADFDARVGALANESRKSAEALEQTVAAFQGRAAELAASTEDQGLDLAALRQSLVCAGERSLETLREIEKRLLERLTALEAESAGERARLAAELQGLQGVEDRLGKQMGVNLAELGGKIESLGDLLGGLQSQLPRLQAFGDIKDGLVRIETSLRTLFDQVGQAEWLGEALPRIITLGRDLARIRTGMEALTGELAASGKDNREALALLTQRVQGLEDLFRSGIERGEESRQSLRRRLMELTYTLRNELWSLESRAPRGPRSFLGRLFLRRPVAPGLDRAEWERLGERLERAVDGLEDLLADSG